MLEPITLAVLAIVLIAALTQSTFGFGNALIAMPLLIMLAGKDMARPLVALLSTSVAIGVVIKDWRDIRLQGSWVLIAGSAVGIPLGLWWAGRAPDYLVNGLLAIIVIGFASFRLAGMQSWQLKTDRWGVLFALTAGILGGAYNTYGPPLVVYGTLRGWSQEEFRANMQLLFMPMGLVIWLGHWYEGYWTPTVMTYYLLSLPLVIGAVIVGRRINQSFPVQRFYTALYIILIGLGLMLLTQAIQGTIHEMG